MSYLHPDSSGSDRAPGRRWFPILSALAIFAGLYLLSLVNYLFFHSIAEIFTIVIAFGIFVIAWNSRGVTSNPYLIFIGIAYLFVGGIDVVHALAYKGMRILPGENGNLPTQLWIAARYLESITLVVAPWLPGRLVNPRHIFAGYALVFAAVLASIFSAVFPVCYVEGSGLTPFKKISEYAISLILAAALLSLLARKYLFDARVLRLLILSIVFTIASELAFTFYVGVYDFSNLAGHFFKIISFYLIYRAIIRTGLIDPYLLIFRDLKSAQESLQKAHAQLETRVEERTAELRKSNELLKAEIEERKRAEETIRLKALNEKELEKSRDELEIRVRERTAEVYRQAELLDLTHEAIIVRDLDGLISFWNKGAAEVYGWAKEEAVGRIMRDLLHTEFLVPRDEIVSKILLEGRWEGEMIHNRKDGKKIHVLSRATLKKDEKGNPIGVMLINNDISQRVKLEEQLRQAHKMEALGTLAGGIAHDFNNLLMPILINTDLALLDIQAGRLPSAESLLLASEGAKRGQELVRQIIAFSRQKEDRRRPVEITPVFKEAMKFLKSTIPASIEIRERVEAEPAVISANPIQIHQILMNLCNNAAHAMKEKGGILEIGLANVECQGDFLVQHTGVKPGPHLRLTVKDTGSGMAPEVRERAFDPFFTTKDIGEGTGMGLAVVHGIVKKHEGAITLESEVGKGTLVSVFFPLVDGERREGQDSSLGPIPRGTERVLLVDDEEIQVRTLQAMLERLGYRVTAKTDPQEALKAFRARPDAFDLVITDMAMPRLRGDRLAAELLSIRGGLPIILCTGFSERVDEAGARAIGIRHFAMKPFSVREIAHLIRQGLAK